MTSVKNSLKGWFTISGTSILISLMLFSGLMISGSRSGLRCEESEDRDLAGLPVRKDGTIGNILRRGTIVVGLQRDYRPYHIENPVSGYPGIDAEIAELLGRELGVRVEYRFFTLSRLFDAVVQNKVDLALGGVSATMHRSLFVNFTDPYLITTPAALLNRRVLPPVTESPDFHRRKVESLSDLRNLGRLRLGVKAGTTHEKILKTEPEFRIHDIITYNDRQSLVEALSSGEVDALVADGVYINALMSLRPEFRTRFHPVIKSYQEEHVSMVVSPQDEAFMLYMNFFIKEARRTGKLDRILSRYMDSGEWIK